MLLKSRFYLAIIWLLFITVLMVIPGSEIPEEKWFHKIYLDKLVHVFFFSVLIYLFYQPLRHKPENWLPWITITAFLYGVAMEFVQEYWAVDRSFDKWDIVADVFGCTIGYISCTVQTRIELKK